MIVNSITSSMLFSHLDCKGGVATIASGVIFLFGAKWKRALLKSKPREIKGKSREVKGFRLAQA